jgi:hypothetical protein
MGNVAWMNFHQFGLLEENVVVMAFRVESGYGARWATIFFEDEEKK